MVNKANVKLWVEDLMTTDARQIGSSLRQDYTTEAGAGFCCLGRACEVYIAQGHGDLRWNAEDGVNGAYVSNEGALWFELLPPVVAGWLGLEADPCIGQEVDDEGKVVTATIANDRLDWTFRQIGEAIADYYDLDED